MCLQGVQTLTGAAGQIDVASARDLSYRIGPSPFDQARPGRRALLPRRGAALALTVLTLLTAAGLALAHPVNSRSRRASLNARPAASQARKADCAYTANSIAALSAFERLVGRQFSCVMVFNNAAPDWQGWRIRGSCRTRAGV